MSPWITPFPTNPLWCTTNIDHEPAVLKAVLAFDLDRTSSWSSTNRISINSLQISLFPLFFWTEFLLDFSLLHGITFMNELIREFSLFVSIYIRTCLSCCAQSWFSVPHQMLFCSRPSFFTKLESARHLDVAAVFGGCCVCCSLPSLSCLSKGRSVARLSLSDLQSEVLPVTR